MKFKLKKLNLNKKLYFINLKFNFVLDGNLKASLRMFFYAIYNSLILKHAFLMENQF